MKIKNLSIDKKRDTALYHLSYTTSRCFGWLEDKENHYLFKGQVYDWIRENRNKIDGPTTFGSLIPQLERNDLEKIINSYKKS